jgi:hypothetical protein
MKIVKHKKGQFIIFATLIIAVMIISIGTIMYSTVTYFKHERWQEYLMVIDNIELGSRRVVELSLANYTILNGTNNQILVNNLNNWRTNLTKAYPAFGVALTYSAANGSHYAYGVNASYSFGLARLWYNETSFSAANAAFTLNLTSAGLTGYKFMATSFFRIRILNATNDDGTTLIILTADVEELTPLLNLQKNKFEVQVNGETISSANWTLKSARWSDEWGSFVYEIRCTSEMPLPPSYSVQVIAWDTRDIKVIANSTVT